MVYALIPAVLYYLIVTVFGDSLAAAMRSAAHIASPGVGAIGHALAFLLENPVANLAEAAGIFAGIAGLSSSRV